MSTTPHRHRYRHALAAMGLCLLVGACGLQAPPVDTANPPPGAFGSNGDSDIAAVNLSSWAFGSTRALRDRPIEAARAVAAVDYLAGDLSTSGRWMTLSPIVQMQMIQARKQVRAAVGIAPDARSQVVVDSLAGYAAALASQDGQAARYLANPVFTLGPDATAARLRDMPFLSETNIATQRASAAIGSGNGAPDSNQR